MIWATVRKELVSLWTSPVPYVVGALVSGAVGVLFVDTLRAREQAVFQPMVPLAGFLILAVAPALSMRTLADESRSGTLDVLLASGASAARLVLAKWIATVVTLVALLLPLSVHAALLLWWGEPDVAPMVTGAIGLILLAALATAVGVAASSLTSSLPVAAMGSFVVLLLAWFIHPSPESASLRTLSARLSLSDRVRGLASGAIDTGSVAFFVTTTVVCLIVARAAVARRRADRHLRSVAVAAGLVAAVALTQAWVDDHDRLIDLTAGRTLSLSSETKSLLRALPASVDITAFISHDEPGRVEAVALLDRYERTHRNVTARVLDPLARPGEVQRLGIDPMVGGVALELGDEVELAAAVTEQDLTLALARLVRGELPRVCVTTGHGELDATSTLSNGLSRATGVLRDNGYEVGTVDLLVEPSVPPDCGAVVVAGPATSLAPAGSALREWHRADGRLLVLAESDLDAGLDEVLRGSGLRLLGGIVAEADPGSVIAGDPTAPIIRRYGSANPVVRSLPPTFLVGTGGIELDETHEAGRTVNRLADTSAASLLLAEPYGDRSDARTGPITVMAAVDASRNVEGTIHRRRLVVIADADFATNAYIGEAGNARLLVQAVDWLTVDESLVSITSNLAAPRPLELTAARRTYALLLSAGVLPGLLLVSGAVVWALRRRA